jgi:hypothetical protein
VTAALRVPFSFLRSFLSLPFPFLFFSSFLLPSFQAPRLQQEPGTGAYIKESKCLFCNLQFIATSHNVFFFFISYSEALSLLAIFARAAAYSLLASI